MLARYTASIATSTLITLGLLAAMQQMIRSGKAVYTEHDVRQWTPYVVERIEPPPLETRRQPPEKRIPEAAPPVPRSEGPASGSARIPVRDPKAPAVTRSRAERWAGPINGDLLPIVKVQPVYPTSALKRGIEGSVIVEFTVTESGGVADARAVESTHPVFESAAVEAALRFRYRPRIVNGESVRVTGVRNLIRFELTGPSHD